MSDDEGCSGFPGATLIERAIGDGQASPCSFKFSKDYQLDEMLRSGSYGKVYTTHHITTQETYAVKVIDRSKLKPKDDRAVFREVGVLKDLLGVSNIVGLADFYEEPKTFYVVQVFAPGGDVFDRLAKRTSYTEKDARDLVATLLQTMMELHKRKLVHRDLKPENLLLRDRMDDADILLADFGFATYVPEEGLKTRCGTPAFVAPEILVGRNYFQEVDMWSTGCILYMLIGGYPPFQDESHRGLFRKIRAADFTFHDCYWKNVSVNAKQLITNLLTVDPSRRLTAQQALGSSWLQMHVEMLSKRDLSVSLSEIKKFHARRTLKSAMRAVLWSVGTAFKHEKMSDLTKAADEHDEKQAKKIKSVAAAAAANPSMKVEQLVADHKDEFSLSKTNKKLFKEVYELGNKIHRGSFALVKECLHKEWDQKYAVKIIKRDDSKPENDYGVLHEVAIMNQLNHEHIVKVVDFFEEPDYYYIVMELMSGGDVFDRIIEMNQYTEKDARDLTKLLLEAVENMHSNGIAHRDLKPQNLLLKSKDDNATIKVGDFGFARRVHTPKSLTSRCGTPSYVAPEILKSQPYDTMCDMWSVGVIVFVLLCGYTPFMQEDQNQMFEKIKHGEWEFIEDDWKNISPEAKELIRGLLTTDPDARLSAKRALRSKWINEDEKMLSSRDLSQSALAMRSRRPRLQTVARAFMAMSMVAKTAAAVGNPIQGEDGSHQLL